MDTFGAKIVIESVHALNEPSVARSCDSAKFKHAVNLLTYRDDLLMNRLCEYLSLREIPHMLNYFSFLSSKSRLKFTKLGIMRIHV